MNLKLYIMVFCILSVFLSNTVSEPNNIPLRQMPSPIYASSDAHGLQWNYDSSYVEFYSGFANLGSKYYYPDSNHLSDNRAANESLLSESDQAYFNPFLENNSTVRNLGIKTYQSPDKQKIAYALNEPIQNGAYSLYPIAIGFLKPKLYYKTTVYVSSPNQAAQIIWSINSQNVIVVGQGVEGYGGPVLYGYVSGVIDNKSQITSLNISDLANLMTSTYNWGGYFRNGQLFNDIPIFGVSNKPYLVLTNVTGYNHDSSVSVLALLNLKLHENSVLYTQFLGMDANAAAFSLKDEAKIWVITSRGLLLYDTVSNTETAIESQITSQWTDEAVFSPDRRWLAIMHIADDQNHHIYIIRLPDGS